MLNKINTHIQNYPYTKENVAILTEGNVVTKEMIDEVERIKLDTCYGDYLLGRLFTPQLSLKERMKAFKVAKLFKRNCLDTYTWMNRTSDIAEISAAISHFETIEKFSKKLEIPIEILLSDSELVDFIKKNSLHHRIDSTYLKRGYGPRVKKGKVLFPVNSGSPFNDDDVSWVPCSKILKNEAGRVKFIYGPFGFQVNASEIELIPIKLQDRSEEDCASIRLELVTSVPTYNPLRILQGSLGHGWIRVYIPEDKEEDTGREFVYSIGFFLRGALKMPDLTEFVPNIDLVTVQKIITQETWEEVKAYIENIQAALLGKETDNPEIQEAVKNLQEGTCCNFSADIYKRATGVQIDGRLPSAKKFEPIIRPAEYVLGKVSPASARWLARLRRGFFPGVMIQEQHAL